MFVPDRQCHLRRFDYGAYSLLRLQNDETQRCLHISLHSRHFHRTIGITVQRIAIQYRVAGSDCKRRRHRHRITRRIISQNRQNDRLPLPDNRLGGHKRESEQDSFLALQRAAVRLQFIQGCTIRRGTFYSRNTYIASPATVQQGSKRGQRDRLHTAAGSKHCRPPYTAVIGKSYLITRGISSLPAQNKMVYITHPAQVNDGIFIVLMRRAPARLAVPVSEVDRHTTGILERGNGDRFV